MAYGLSITMFGSPGLEAAASGVTPAPTQTGLRSSKLSGSGCAPLMTLDD